MESCKAGKSSKNGAVGMAEESCPICLDDFTDKAFIVACFHSYCFQCVLRAAEVSGNVCPMCKTEFSKVIHNVRANNDYEVFEVSPTQSASSASGRQTRQEGLQTFRGYRTTMFHGRQVLRNARDQRGYPMTSTTERRNNWDRTAPQYYNNTICTSMPPGSSSSAINGQSSNRHCHCHHEREFGRSIRRSAKCAPVSTRQSVYSTGVHALPMAGRIRSGGHGITRTRDISAAYFKKNPASTHRLFPWLSREFEALVGKEHMEFMMQLVLSIIDKVDLESESFATHLEPFLNERTSHFMHELISFAKSSSDIKAYDGKVRYDWPAGHPEALRQAGRVEEGGASDLSSGSTSGQPLPTPVTLGNDVRQMIFEELAEPGDQEVQLIQLCSSPIIIHGSDSEPEDTFGQNQQEVTHLTNVQVDNQEARSVQGLTRRSESAGEEDSQSTATKNYAITHTPSSGYNTEQENNTVSLTESASNTAGPSNSSLEELQPILPSISGASTTRVAESDTDLISVFTDEAELRTSTVASGNASGDVSDSTGPVTTGTQGKETYQKLEAASTQPNTEVFYKSGHSSHKSKRHRSKLKHHERSRLRERSREYERHQKRKDKWKSYTSSSTLPPRGKDDRKIARKHRHGYEKYRDNERVEASKKYEEGSSSSEFESLSSHLHGSKMKKHKTSLYSDDLLESNTGSMHRPRTEKTHKHKHGYKKMKKSFTSPGKVRSEQNEYYSMQTDEVLKQEALAIEDEIRISKLEILRSGLRKERIELLHRNIHGTPLPGGVDRDGGVGCCIVDSKAGCSDQLLQEELVQLDRKIASGKRQLLKVMRSMEEGNM